MVCWMVWRLSSASQLFKQRPQVFSGDLGSNLGDAVGLFLVSGRTHVNDGYVDSAHHEWR